MLICHRQRAKHGLTTGNVIVPNRSATASTPAAADDLLLITGDSLLLLSGDKLIKKA